MLDLAAQYFTERFSRNEHFPAFHFIFREVWGITLSPFARVS